MFDLLKKRAPIETRCQESIIHYDLLTKPNWTTRSYNHLAREGYQSNVIVYRAVTLIARGIASIPLVLIAKSREIGEHPLINLLKNPSLGQSGASLLETMVSYLLLSGNSYTEIISNTKGILGLCPLRPDRVAVLPGTSGHPLGWEYTVDGKKRRLINQLIRPPLIHLKYFHPLDDWYGMSPIEVAARAIDQHNTVGGHNLALLQNGGRPSGALIVKSSQLTHEQKENLRDDIKAIYEGARHAGKIMVLEGEFEWKEMGLSPKDLDFLEGKSLTAREIAQAFGVPPMLVGVRGDATFANYKEARFHLWEDTILPLMDFIVSELNRWLIPWFDKGLRLAYRKEAIPALAAKREMEWARLRSADFLTINEKRQVAGYQPVPGGDVLPCLSEAIHVKEKEE